MKIEMKGLCIDFDDQLNQIHNLQWLPWIGENFKRTKTLILGESHYEDGDDWQSGNREATRIMVDKHLTRSKVRIYTNTEKVLFNTGTPTAKQSESLWKSAIYWNLVQRLLNSRNDDRPEDIDFDNGWSLFFQIVELLKPTTCIVLGKTSCGRLGFYLNNNITLWERNVSEFYAQEKIINLQNKNHHLQLIFVNHPTGSRGFDYKHWATLIEQYRPELCQLLRNQNTTAKTGLG